MLFTARQHYYSKNNCTQIHSLHVLIIIKFWQFLRIPKYYNPRYKKTAYSIWKGKWSKNSESLEQKRKKWPKMSLRTFLPAALQIFWTEILCNAHIFTSFFMFLLLPNFDTFYEFHYVIIKGLLCIWKVASLPLGKYSWF